MVILLEKDPFVEAELNVAADGFDSNVNVRRPVYGMEVKEPRFAYMSIYQDTSAGTEGLVPISLLDSSAPGGYSDANHNFIIQSLQETRQERVQIIETFGDHFTFFYGEKPIVLQVSGMLFNTADFNWKNEWLANYDQYLRGTKCVENRARVFLGWDDVLAQGYILSSNVVYDSNQPAVCPFSFALLLSKPPLDLSRSRVQIDTDTSFVGINRARSAARPVGSLVNKAEEARALENSGLLVEYLTALHNFGRHVIDPATGDSVLESGASGDVPQSIDNVRTASWVTGTDPATRQWKDESAALLALNTQLTAQQAGVDLVTARQAIRKNPAAFPLATRSSALTTISPALSSGVVNAAAVISDVPDLE